jgi:hydroxyethylthiazole kinase-like uncharacterized protein yjeF
MPPLARFRFRTTRTTSDKGAGRLLVMAEAASFRGSRLWPGSRRFGPARASSRLRPRRAFRCRSASRCRKRGSSRTGNREGCVDESAIETIVDWAGKAQAVMIGCGMQHGPPLDKLLDALFACAAGIPLVLDAAVLGSLAPRADALRAWKGGAIVLPHAGEMARLLQCDAEEVGADPLGAARRAAERFNVVAVMKGQSSYIVAPDGQAFRFKGGGVGLATSGSGDTLAGIVGGLCARGADPLTAALWGVYLHGEAGRRLSKDVGRVGFLAREILDLVPRLMEGR